MQLTNFINQLGHYPLQTNSFLELKNECIGSESTVCFCSATELLVFPWDDKICMSTHHRQAALDRPKNGYN